MTKEQIMQEIIHALYTGKVIGDKDLMQVLEEAHSRYLSHHFPSIYYQPNQSIFKDYAISSIIDKTTTNILNTSILKSQLSEAYKDCIYRNEEGGCWAIKLKCDPRNENCDYRKEEKLSEAGEEKPIIKKCRQCRFFLDEHCEPCESCYPIAYSNWQPR